MNKAGGFIGTFLILSSLGFAQTQIETEPVRELKRTNTLGTCRYDPAPGETDAYEKLLLQERVTGSILEDYDIHQKDGYVSWYGIVRGITQVEDGHWRLLLEQKYFDGLTDCHIMLVSIGGSGDYLADVQTGSLTIPALALVRVYGTITGRENGAPVLDAEYIRVWPWMTFTFSNLHLGDRTNPRWKAARKIPDAKIYDPWPNEKYYRAALGDPSKYGFLLKDK